MSTDANTKLFFHSLGIAMGILFILYYREAGISVVKFSKKYFGKNYSKNTIQIIYLVIGITFVFFGLLDAIKELGMIKY